MEERIYLIKIKMAKVTIEFEDNIQANALAIMAEDGLLKDFINKQLNSIGLPDNLISEDSEADVQFDEDDFSPHHEVTYL